MARSARNTTPPTAAITAFHPVNPADNPPDYAEDEPNRVMIPVTAMAGTFLCKGKLRISTLSGLSMSIEQSHASWTSIYEAEVTNPYLAQMPAMHVPLILVRPSRVPLALEGD